MSKLFTVLLFIILFSNGLLCEEKLFRWAADAEGNAPYIFQDPNNPNKIIGFEVDFAKELANQLSQKTFHVQNQWDGLIAGLARNDYDVAINGLEITKDREENVNFSIPYYVTYEQIVVRSTETRFKNLADLYGKKVGALKSSLAERILQANGGFDIRSYEGEVNAFEDLKNGRIDAALVDAPIALYYASWNPQLKLIGEPVGEVLYGVVLRQSDTLLLTQVNAAIDKMIKNGKLREILAKWNLWNSLAAEKFNDKTEKNITPSEFDRFLKAQGIEKTWLTTLERYVNFLPLFLRGALVTLGLSVVSMIIAILVGLVIAIFRVYGNSFVSKLTMLYIEIIRGTPLLVQLFFIFYALPSIGIKLSPFIAAIIGLGLNYSAYEAENYRAGLFSVPKGQMEAALALGMHKRQALRWIILPQAFRIVIPPITNDFISLLKDSSLVSVITMVELTKVYNQVAGTYYDFFGTGIIVAAFYLLLGLPFVKIAKKTEKYLQKEQMRKYN